jgi:hypothetical protein
MGTYLFEDTAFSAYSLRNRVLQGMDVSTLKAFEGVRRQLSPHTVLIFNELRIPSYGYSTVSLSDRNCVTELRTTNHKT